MSKAVVEGLRDVHDVADWVATHQETVLLENHDGQPIAVMLSYDKYMELLKDREDLEDIRTVAAARERNEPGIPLDEAKRLVGTHHGRANG